MIRTGWRLNIILVVCVIFGLTVGYSFMEFSTSIVVKVNLTSSSAESTGGKMAWQFKVNNRDVSAGKSVRVFEKKFNIQTIESKSRKKIDEFDIGSLIEDGDSINHAYYGEAFSQGESLYIYIQHKDGTSREVKININ